MNRSRYGTRPPASRTVPSSVNSSKSASSTSSGARAQAMMNRSACSGWRTVTCPNASRMPSLARMRLAITSSRRAVARSMFVVPAPVGCDLTARATLDRCTWSRGLEDARYRLGVDIGGTFTDMLVMNEQTGETFVLKTPSTPGSVDGVTNGIRELERRHGIQGGQIGYFSHGTTIGVNTLLQRSGAQVGALATRGFRDLL